MKKLNITSENFKLECEAEFFEEDISLPGNSILNIKIDSGNFTASATMDINIKAFNLFINELADIYKYLKGSAVLKEPYGSNYIEFQAKSNGHIYVTGSINNYCANGYNQELIFENEFDQTYLKNFAESINKNTDN